jgi:protoporphyrinogen oxidase
MPESRVVILGAGPAGVGAAYQLTRESRARVTVLEQRPVAGGNAGSFDIGEQRVDYGSHRLHPACDPEILSDIRALLGDDLVERPRHGRIRLRGRWIHFPLKPFDLLARLDLGFTAGTLTDMARRVLPTGGAVEDTFAGVLRASLGGTICDQFYFPYARKIWGMEPQALSAIQAHRRVAANWFGKLLRKILGQLPGVKPVGFRHFYYPTNGYGAISEAYADEAAARGADLRFDTLVTSLERDEDGDQWRVRTRSGDDTEEVEADYVWSTLPITALARITTPTPPQGVLAAADNIRYRSMLLVYLTLGTDRFSEYDAHYFPGEEGGMRRLSEPKNYAALGRPAGRTTLCAELPCSTDDELWEMDAPALGERVARELESVGLRIKAPIEAVEVRRLRFAYPIYEIGYERHLRVLDDWASTLPAVLTFGRQGLFAHDNTHHALYMAYAAAECFGVDGFDAERWAEYRREFETHVVED